MEQIASALGDGARWRIVELLAERPRSVGELAELTGLRQPQTTKHLQTLARSGLVTVTPLGQRRVYALDSAPLKEFERRLRDLIERTDAHAGDRDVIARYQASIEAETAAADRAHWADGRTFSFERVLPAPREVVWRHWTDPNLLASWWAPPSMTTTECVIEPSPGGRAVLAYRDAEGTYRSEGRVHTAIPAERLVFDLSIVDAFTATYDVTFTEDTRLHIDMTITESTMDAAQYVAGIETGWGQVLDNLTRALGAKP
ncbi:metalloregulator ArsR/SmtB family transcription factor [Labedaea rhizosphaerae]|uniref:Uncharacterized protein YndB with AHSA1/START domain n=1 Tax=Labedaea rhizosphaerae TaxID=598644 RepID=A0A4R6RQP3_LABRH|nr:metalloregulator ArsR/SmtB family transcription factor [Labedaea rhizosphaerae]TDP88974.1 uncharacterized protein YndB with AHSA1/START domain [Labedaea rhizosphaerae]